jgi:hypothetical protein
MLKQKSEMDLAAQSSAPIMGTKYCGLIEVVGIEFFAFSFQNHQFMLLILVEAA